MTYRSIVTIAVSALILSACANFESIGRRSNLPDDGSRESRAIHLDAKQRLVIAKGGDGTANDPSAVCAEPSPDALSAIAASAGIGASVPSQGAASAATALQTSAASIGLRTQSITLMRDALYRVCEAYYSGQLSKAQVMLLLARSQDLTATVVAVEQLTGAVVAQQAILSGQANSQSIATLLANKEALEQIGAQLERDQKAVEEATTAEASARAALEAEQKKLDDAKDALAEEPDNDDRKTAVERAEIDVGRAEDDFRLKGSDLALRKSQLSETQKVRDAVARQLDSATASASAAASGSGQFGANQSRDNLTDATAAAIAGAVENIVTRVVGKNYLTDACIAIITQPDLTTPPDERRETVRACYELMKQANQSEILRFKGVVATSSLEPEPIDRTRQLLVLVTNLPARAAIRLATTPPVALNPDVEALVNATDPQRLRARDASVARSILKRMLATGAFSPDELTAWDAAMRAAISG